MSKRPTTLLLALLALSTLETGAQQMYRWVDENGQVHYGDHVPPAYAGQDREIVNPQGVTIRTINGTATEEEIAEIERQQTAAQASRIADVELANRDRVLLSTYLSVDDIFRLRDQRVEMLDAQIAVAEQYLASLNQRLMEVQQNADQFRPYSEDPKAPQIPENLELDLAQTVDSIQLYEDTLAHSREQRQELSDAFARDIQRFKELKGD